ncbi:MAG: GGDEF domain-containing protein [Desulfuromonadaceae bacterium]|nr:GGDEF domain-containing protein [Desulfuromonadaceae bacterium]
MSALEILLKLGHKIQLPTLPTIAVRILEEVNKDEPSFTRFTKIISADTALSSKILRIANSMLFSPVKRIDTIEMALTRLGVTQVTNIALSFLLVQTFQQKVPGDHFDFKYFWRRSVTSAVAADLLTKTFCHNTPNVFIAGLLHDIGILIAYTQLPEYRALFNPQDRRGQGLRQREQELLGFSHDELGAEILTSWKLPSRITQPILYHHAPEQAPKEHTCAATAIQLADLLSAIMQGKPASEKLLLFKERLKKRGVKDQDTDQLIQNVFVNSVQILSLFDIPAEQMRTPEELLQEANEKLSTLNMASSQLLNQYECERERIIRQSEKLSAANVELSRMAFQDCLTGLYNLRYFHDFFDRELRRAQRYHNHFALALFDLDDFKLINDTYGHMAGDIVLKQVAKIAQTTLRSTDLIVRYGGEEFAIIFPETGLQEAVEIADRLRQAIRNAEIEVEAGQHVRVTTSFGVVHYSPEDKQQDKKGLIRMADEALYAAKRAGKDRVCQSPAHTLH